MGNIVAGGLIGWGVDSATGADNKYEKYVTITMVPLAQPAPPPPVPPDEQDDKAATKPDDAAQAEPPSNSETDEGNVKIVKPGPTAPPPS